MMLKISNICFILQVSRDKISILQAMRRCCVVTNPALARLNFWMKVPQKFHTRKMLASDWSTYFVYPQNNQGNPFPVRQLFSDWCRHDKKHLRHISRLQVREFPKYCTIVIKSPSKVMLRNGFKKFDDHKIPKPKQTLSSVSISNWFIFITRKFTQNLLSIQPKLKLPI